MLQELYARWMYRWETDLTTRDENRIVRPLDWGFDWLKDYTAVHPSLSPSQPTSQSLPRFDSSAPPQGSLLAPTNGVHAATQLSTSSAEAGEPARDPAHMQAAKQASVPSADHAPVQPTYQASVLLTNDTLSQRPDNPLQKQAPEPFPETPSMPAPPSASPAAPETAHLQAEQTMLAINAAILADSDTFFNYTPPTDYRLEQRHPELFPTNVRPETLAQDAELKARAARGELPQAEFLRFTSPIRTPYPENDLVNARWYPARPDPQTGAPSRKAIIVMPQWNADAFSHNALCSIFNRFGVSALRLSKPYHDIRRPAELERSDYAVSSNIGRTLAACRQAVIDIRCCVDWLASQGYEQFGVLGTSLGSCYAFLAAAHDERLEVCAFNHASTSFGDVVWTGQSTRHIRAAFEQEGLTQPRLNALWGAISPIHYMHRYKETAAKRNRRTLVVHATYDLTFLEEFSKEVLRNFKELGISHESKVLPCGHYTTGETPYKFLDGWYLGSFVYRTFRTT